MREAPGPKRRDAGPAKSGRGQRRLAEERETAHQLTDLAGEAAVAAGAVFGVATGAGSTAICERVVLAFDEEERRMPLEGGVTKPEPPMRGEPGENSMRICASLGVRVLGLVPASAERISTGWE